MKVQQEEEEEEEESKRRRRRSRRKGFMALGCKSMKVQEEEKEDEEERVQRLTLVESWVSTACFSWILLAELFSGDDQKVSS